MAMTDENLMYQLKRQHLFQSHTSSRNKFPSSSVVMSPPRPSLLSIISRGAMKLTNFSMTAYLRGGTESSRRTRARTRPETQRHAHKKRNAPPRFVLAAALKTAGAHAWHAPHFAPLARATVDVPMLLLRAVCVAVRDVRRCVAAAEQLFQQLLVEVTVVEDVLVVFVLLRVVLACSGPRSRMVSSKQEKQATHSPLQLFSAWQGHGGVCQSPHSTELAPAT